MIAVVAAVLVAVSFSAQAQETTDICGRTQAVVDEILRLTATEDDECGSVSVSEMAANFTGSISLSNKGITSLEPGDFDGLSGETVLTLRDNRLTELKAGTFRGLSSLTTLSLLRNSLGTFAPGVFSDLPRLIGLALGGNPDSPFRFMVRFEPETLETDFTTAEVKLVLIEGAPREVTVNLSATGGTLSVNSLTLAVGATESAAVTVTRSGQQSFRLSQDRRRLGGSDINYSGFDIVTGPPITVGGIRIKARVFLEGALE